MSDEMSEFRKILDLILQSTPVVKKMNEETEFIDDRFKNKLYEIPKPVKELYDLIPHDFLTRASKTSWCYIDIVALQITTSLNLPIVEVCGGSGFWSKILHELGAKVHCTDNKQEKQTKTYYDIEDLDWIKAIQKYSTIYDENYILFATWTRDTLTDKLFENAKKPKYILWQGELAGGCTGYFNISGYKPILCTKQNQRERPEWYLYDICYLFIKIN